MDDGLERVNTNVHILIVSILDYTMFPVNNGKRKQTLLRTYCVIAAEF